MFSRNRMRGASYKGNDESDLCFYFFLPVPGATSWLLSSEVLSVMKERFSFINKHPEEVAYMSDIKTRSYFSFLFDHYPWCIRMIHCNKTSWSIYQAITSCGSVSPLSNFSPDYGEANKWWRSRLCITCCFLLNNLQKTGVVSRLFTLWFSSRRHCLFSINNYEWLNFLPCKHSSRRLRRLQKHLRIGAWRKLVCSGGVAFPCMTHPSVLGLLTWLSCGFYAMRSWR